ncbi:MAG TPA: aminotransferase class V-fold PLP-dependent enzyme, partial [Candidatus Limnocylindrales bacterium]
MVGPFLPDDEKMPALREALPSTAAGIYLNTGTCGPIPRETAHAMAEAEAWELRTGRADRNYWEDSLERRAEARAAVAAVLGTGPNRIALTHGTSDGMNIATWAVDWRDGDRVVTTSLEHPGLLAPLRALRDRRGVELAIADIGMGGDPAAVLAALDRAITPRTRLVALSHVTWATGARLPIREIVELAHGRDALVAVDGAQSAGAMHVSMEDLGPDFYAVPAQKWLLGPDGIGAVYCAESVMDRPRLAFAGWASFESMDLAAEGELWPDARRFEIAGFHQPS